MHFILIADLQISSTASLDFACLRYLHIFSVTYFIYDNVDENLNHFSIHFAENVFSSLVGLQFMWHMIPETEGSSHHLAHLPLKDSPLSDCGGLCGDLNIQIKLEDSVCMPLMLRIPPLIQIWSRQTKISYFVIFLFLVYNAGCIFRSVCCKRN